MVVRVKSLAPPIKVESWLLGQSGNERTLSKRAGTILPAISGGMLLLAACFRAIKNDLEPTPENAASGAPAYVREHVSESSPGKPILEKMIAEHEIDWALLAAGTGASPSSMNSEAGGKHTKIKTLSSISGRTWTREFEPSP